MTTDKTAAAPERTEPSGGGEVVKALLNYQQADEDGVMVLVSRQAVEEAARELADALAERERIHTRWRIALAEAIAALSDNVKGWKQRAEQADTALAKRDEDAERYIWWTQNYGAAYDSPQHMKLYALVPHGKYTTKKHFDAAIDAARKEKQ